MTLSRRPSPFSELVTLRQAMDRLFDDTVYRPYSYGGNGDFGRLPLDVRTTSDALFVEASLPGIKPEDVDITVENGTLTIRAEDGSERQEEQNGWLVREISRGSLMRTVTLPTGLEAEKAEATFEHGVLKLRIPKAEQVKPRQIRIQPVTNGEAKAVGAGNGLAVGQENATANNGAPSSGTHANGSQPNGTERAAGEPAGTQPTGSQPVGTEA